METRVENRLRGQSNGKKLVARRCSRCQVVLEAEVTVETNRSTLQPNYLRGEIAIQGRVS